jgi:small neutral amino acid transporter SnatA (MarC family)
MWWQQRLSEFVTLFLVINSFAALPTFLEMTATFEPAQALMPGRKISWVWFHGH